MSNDDLAALSRTPVVTRPGSTFATRALLPGVVLLGALGLVLYSARESFRPSITVEVAPAVLAQQGSQAPRAGAAMIVQAPGWLEADPYDVAVPALESGVIQELRSLEGDRVEAGQVIALLIDEDAKLAERLARATLANAEASLASARANAKSEEARVAELEDGISRRENLSIKGAVAEGDLAAMKLKLRAQIAALESARAAELRSQAEVGLATVGIEKAELTLSRMQVRTPISGVVLARLAVPGQRMMPDADDPMAGVVVRVYDPAQLRARVDIPLADAAKVKVGDEAEITSESMPGRIFTGKVTRFVHEADVQKNTVQVKVAIKDPAPELKPQMLVKARIRTQQPATAAAASDPTRPDVVAIPLRALVDRTDSQASVWVIDRPTATAVRRQVQLGETSGQSVHALSGLRPGDRVILDPPADLQAGVRVKASDEEEAR